MTQSTLSNSVAVTVVSDLSSVSVVNLPYVSVTVCVAGSTSNCKTVDHILVDTGSTGLRILASALDSTFISSLSSVTASGNQLGECAQFVSGYLWGTVKTADLYLAGEEAASLPIQIVGDSSYSTIPSACQRKGSSMGSQSALGANGIIGLNSFKQDCGSSCVSGTTAGYYYSCASSGSCTDTTVALGSQVQHPVQLFSGDNNGVVLVLPSVASAGAASVSGTLYFGIGTQSNNTLGSATPYGTDSQGYFRTAFNGSSNMYGVIDSGSNGLFFNDSALATCSSGLASGWFCPSAATSLSATITGVSSSTISSNSTAVSFSIANAQTLFGSGYAAYGNLGAPYGSNSYFDFGLPFFFGRSVYVAIENTLTPVGYGPYVAF